MSCLPVTGAIPMSSPAASQQGEVEHPLPTSRRQEPTVRDSETRRNDIGTVSCRSTAHEVPGRDGDIHRTAMRGHPRHESARAAHRSGHPPPDQPEQSDWLPRRWVRKSKRAGFGSPGCRRYTRRKPPRVVRNRQKPKAPADQVIAGGCDGVAPGFGSWETRAWSACMVRSSGSYSRDDRVNADALQPGRYWKRRRGAIETTEWRRGAHAPDENGGVAGT